MSTSQRHLFRSKNLITLLCRLGHSECYSFSLELETALAEAGNKFLSLLSAYIISSSSPASVFHSEFDNFDQLINDLTGKGSIHTAHGIMLQEHGFTIDPCSADVESLPRTKNRSLSITSQANLLDCYMTKRRSPQLDISQLSYPGAEEAPDVSVKLHVVDAVENDV